ncbi:MAG: hypothetical protein A2V90_05730 [Gammaproteobacteria bacterium RBG_16_57_12]|nr:MAG: hypothetical protein A2V90_05730 [Gammaproteobacteria bacterium RBG_16_57_12]
MICLGLGALALSGYATIAAEPGATSPDGKGTQPAAETIKATAPANTPPVAVADSANMRKNTSVAINVLVNDYDPDPNITPAGQLDPASVRITTKPARGARMVVSETGMVTYAPRKNFKGTDVFYYTVKDKEGATSNPGKVTITVK